MDAFNQWTNNLTGVVGKFHGDFISLPLMFILVGTGLYLTLRLRFVQLRYIKHAIKCVSGKYDDPNEIGAVTHFQALCAALSATIGTGNIAGVAIAIAVGGPGAIFWMWVTAAVGMATKFTSCSLAIRYRKINPDGSINGGPMYFLEQGLNLKCLAKVFALFTILSALSAGCMFQANAVANGLANILPASITTTTAEGGSTSTLLITNGVIGIVIAILVGVVIIGGIKRIATVAEKIVPVMTMFYVGSALLIIFLNGAEIPAAFGQIFKYAFTPLAVGGGALGGLLSTTLRMGVARGLFSNEAGIGSAPIAHAAAKTKEMIREGMVSMLGPFIDTLVVCTMTALVILTSGVWQVQNDAGETIYGPGGNGIYHEGVVGVYDVDDGETTTLTNSAGNPYKILSSSSLTIAGFESKLSHWGKWFVAIALVFFAYSSMISWSYYSDQCCEYLLGPKSVIVHRWLFCVLLVAGAMGPLDLIFTLSDVFMAFMAFANLTALIGLSGLVIKETKCYVSRMKSQGDL